MVGGMLGTKQIDQNEANVGESRNGDRILREAGFTVNKDGESVEAQSQMVLIQSTTLHSTDPAFRAAHRGHREDATRLPAGPGPALAAHALVYRPDIEGWALGDGRVHTRGHL